MARQTTLNVSLTGALKQYVSSSVSSGRYESASEVVRDGLRALQDREKAAAAVWADINRKVSVARRQVAAGQTVDGETAMDALIGELDEHRPRRSTRRKRSR